jgi:hypothetical protein
MLFGPKIVSIFDLQTTGSVKYNAFIMTHEYMCLKLAGPESAMFSRYDIDSCTTSFIYQGA